MRKMLLFAATLMLTLMPFAYNSTLAAPGTPGTPGATEKRHCVTFMVSDTTALSAETQQKVAALAADTGKPVSVERAGERLCFATMQEVKDYYKQHGIKDGSEKGQVSAQTVGAGGYAIAILFDGYGYNYGNPYGHTESFVSGSPCTSQSKFYNYVGGIIDDLTSSATLNESYGCTTARFFLDPNLSNGPYYCQYPDSTFPEDCWYIGDPANDLVSSLTIS